MGRDHVEQESANDRGPTHTNEEQIMKKFRKFLLIAVPVMLPPSSTTAQVETGVGHISQSCPTQSEQDIRIGFRIHMPLDKGDGAPLDFAFPAVDTVDKKSEQDIGVGFRIHMPVDMGGGAPLVFDFPLPKPGESPSPSRR